MKLNLTGELSEWFNEHAWKACVRENVPRVRIPHSPQIKMCMQLNIAAHFSF